MDISLIQVPWDSGHYGKRMGKGPIHLVGQGLAEYLENGGNHVELTELKLSNKFITEAGSARDLNVELSKTIAEAGKKGKFPIVLAGNCNTALGTVTGLGLTQPGVIWFDAHADFNTPETTRSGFFDGMALSILTGNSWQQWRKTIPRFSTVDEQNIILVGTRNFDTDEHKLLESSSITLVPVFDIRDNPEKALSKPLQNLSRYCSEVYLHFDLDVFDPEAIQANEFAVGDGLLLSEVKEMVKTICSEFIIRAISFTAYDPSYDSGNQGYRIVKSILDTSLPMID